MSDIRLSHSGRPINEHDLQELETFIGGLICSEYKRFLLRHNGGACLPVARSNLLAYPIAIFLRLEPEKSGGLHNTFLDFSEYRAGPRLLPVAMTLGEEFVCIEVGVTESRVIVAANSQPDRVCAANWTVFEGSLFQIEEEPLPLEVIAEQPWESVQRYIQSGGELVPAEGLSLFSQCIRVNNFDVFKHLVDVERSWGDLDDAVEVAVLNNQLEFLKVIIEMGGDVDLAQDLAVGPDRKAMREFLASLVD